MLPTLPSEDENAETFIKTDSVFQKTIESHMTIVMIIMTVLLLLKFIHFKYYQIASEKTG